MNTAECKQYDLYVYDGYKASVKAEYSMYSSSTERTIVFSDRRPKGFRKFEDQDYDTLSQEEAVWISQTGRKINEKAIKEHEKDYIAYLEMFADVLEEELQRMGGEESA